MYIYNTNGINWYENIEGNELEKENINLIKYWSLYLIIMYVIVYPFIIKLFFLYCIFMEIYRIVQLS